jgi:acetyl esterase/lipase
MATSNDTPTATGTATNEPYVVEDCRGILKLMSDGTVIRSDNPFVSITFPDDGSIESKDLLFDSVHSLHVRLYRPVETPPGTKLPLITYFHGGGFCIGSRTWPNFHTACRRLSAELSALVLSFDYRLAPEHRLPAAIEDAEAALLWLKSQCAGPNTDAWLAESADFTKVFISGESAGGNMTHHMAVKFGPSGLSPVQVRGFIILMPGLIGEEVTRSELECPPSAFLNREACDRYMRLALPAGATRNHPAFNPFGPKSPNLENVEMGLMLVVTAERDMLIDNNLNYVKKLKEMGKKVEMVQIAGEEHAFFSFKPLSEATGEVIRAIDRFMNRTGDSSD